MSKRGFAVLFGITLILCLTVIVILLAKGYQPNFEDRTIDSTGILVATSDPVGASVFIDGKLKTATNTTLNLKPGKYQVRLSIDGYNSWQKEVEIKKEEVFKTNAFLFPKAADLRPLTLNGAQKPFLSPDESRIGYLVASGSANANGVWSMSLSGRPFSGGDLRQLFRDNGLELSSSRSLIWSTDGTILIASAAGKLYQLETDRLNVSPTIISTQQLELLKTQWQKEAYDKSKAQLSKLPSQLPISNFKFSPDESKVLYTASASATLPKILISYLPGTDPTPENRIVEKNRTYVYDLKEDKNYYIGQLLSSISWFATSRHLVINEGKQISIEEYDGTNKAVVYAGPYIDNYVYVWPGTPKIVILTSLNSILPAGENLYTINLR